MEVMPFIGLVFSWLGLIGFGAWLAMQEKQSK
jgi:hypothetical protein